MRDELRVPRVFCVRELHERPPRHRLERVQQRVFLRFVVDVGDERRLFEFVQLREAVEPGGVSHGDTLRGCGFGFRGGRNMTFARQHVLTVQV